MSYSHWKKTAAAALLLLAAGLWMAKHLHAFNPQPDPPAFAMIGVTRFETLRLNVVDTGLPTSVPPGPCQVDLSFLDRHGVTLKHAAMSLMPGNAVFLDLTGMEALMALHETMRAEVRPLAVASCPSDPSHPMQMLAGMELFDNFLGKTSLFAQTGVPAAAIPQ